MSIRKISFSVNEFYHIYNRGNSKQVIFHNTSDYLRFLKILYLANSQNTLHLSEIERWKQKETFNIDRAETLVYIGAYCLMPNHFHILLTPKEENGVSIFMQKLTTAYSMYYNKKYNRTGSLFEGKFKAEHANTDRYLKYLFSYIHLNPLKLFDSKWKEKKIKNTKTVLDFLEKYKYSSYLDYLENDRQEQKIIDIKNFPDYFSNKKLFEKEIFDWIRFTHEARPRG